MQKVLKEKIELQDHIGQLNGQINKYKQKIRELSDNNSTLMNSMSEEKEDDSRAITNYFSTDVYQHKYYDLLKVNQSINQRYLDYQLQFSSVRNIVGVSMINLVDTLPESYTNKLYP